MGYIHTDLISECGYVSGTGRSDAAHMPGNDERRDTERTFPGIYHDGKAGSFYRRKCTFISVPFTGRAELFEAGIASDAGMLQRCGICSPGALEMAPTEEKDERRGKKRPSDCSE